MAAEHFDLEAEREILGAIQLDAVALAMIESLVQAGDFYHPAHALIFAAAQALTARGESVHVITLSNELKARDKLASVGGASYVAGLTDSAPTSAHIEAHAKIVARHALARRVIVAAQQVLAKGTDPTVQPEDLAGFADKSMFDAISSRSTGGLVQLSEAIEQVLERIESAARSGESTFGLKTGLADLDSLTSGFGAGQLVVIAGRPGHGKSSLLMNVAEHVAQQQQKPVLVFSLEMPHSELAGRILSGRSRVEYAKLRSMRVSQDDWNALVQAANDVFGVPILIRDDGNVTLPEMRSSCRRLQIQHGLSMVVLDYLQLMKSGLRHDSREREISEISRGAKLLAKELGVPFVIASQLNRECEKRADKRPMLSDLRESGAVEQDADVVAFVYRQEIYEPDNNDVKGLAELIVAKQRNGPTGTVHLGWDGASTRFRNLDPGSRPRREKRGRKLNAAAVAALDLDDDGGGE